MNMENLIEEISFEADGKVVEELKRVAGIDADVVRRLITKLD